MVTDLRLENSDGTDTLSNIQYLDFSDLLVDLGVEDSGTGDPNGDGDEPVARNDFYITKHARLTIDVLLNDSQTNAESLSTVLIKGPGRGRLHSDSDGNFVYIPPKHFEGFVKFKYVATDGLAESNVATVRIKVGHHGTSHSKISRGSGFDDDRQTGQQKHDHTGLFDITKDQALPPPGFHFGANTHLDHTDLPFRYDNSSFWGHFEI